MRMKKQSVAKEFEQFCTPRKKFILCSQPGVMVHISNPSTKEIKAEGLA